jgi:hypothetical protein
VTVWQFHMHDASVRARSFLFLFNFQRSSRSNAPLDLLRGERDALHLRAGAQLLLERECVCVVQPWGLDEEKRREERMGR